MKERGILMRGEMVRATLDDLKTQTRRIVEPQLEMVTFVAEQGPLPAFTGKLCPPGFTAVGLNVFNTPGNSGLVNCPYGKPGDRLWVKETHWRYGKWVRNGLTKKGKPAWRFRSMDNLMCYEEEMPESVERGKRGKSGWHKRPSIFMPRKLSRITLEIVAVRVDRLQDISETDCYAEGIAWPTAPNLGSDVTRRDNARNAYRALWESINGKGSWAKNTWLWVITFKRIKP